MAKKLGTLIKEARAEKEWTQAQLAQKVRGLEASDISKIERGLKVPSEDEIKRLAKALGVTQKSLLEAPKGSAAKTGSTAGKTGKAKSTGTSVKLTAAEKRLVELYRKADTETKKAAVNLLSGKTPGIGGLLQSLLGSSTQITGAAKEESLQDLLGTVLGQLSGKRELPDEQTQE